MAKRKSSTNTFSAAAVFLSIIGIVVLVIVVTSSSSFFNLQPKAGGGYDPKLAPDEFTTTIASRYLALPRGRKLVYEGETVDGAERVEITISGKTKSITYKGKSFTTLVYRDKVWVDGELVEDTRDYLAQHKDTGDVWYFGEDVDNYENGVIIDHEGSWIAGKDVADVGTIAKPGIWVKHNPRRGETYRQEYYPDVAEDMVKVLSKEERVAVPYGTFTNCLKTRDTTPLDPTSREHKVYCPDVNALVLEKDLVSGEKLELINATAIDDDDEDDE